MKILAISIALLVACSSKHDAPPDPAPVAPPAQPLVPGLHGIAMQGNVLVDTVAGYRITFPDAPTVEDQPMDSPHGTRPGVVVTLGLGGGALIFKLHRMQPGDYDRANPDPGIEESFEAIRHDGVASISDDVVTLAGLRGRKLVGKKSFGEEHAELRLWILIDPAHDTVYELTVVIPDGSPADPAIDHFAGSFTRSRP